ncbi:cytochrome c oxidase accessory protein CcoG [Algibacillus agarilyticus]|uniref:cytochrome c oxidase accessory protein CcoG n=1 Tax=Algibacillus agarilyticus TaxID=2234133 RepID=UPI000DD0EA8B|nr:cytochrome c oxidase accessory protein CcoG [Algibacillus agarilyticus]
MQESNRVKPQKIKIHQPKTPNDHFSARNRIYVRAVKGLYQTVRRRMGMVFMAAFMILPWLEYNGNQAVLFDLSEQKFNIFALSLWPQDLTLLAWLFIIAAFALFFITTFAGRVWCGYLCPQTVWTFIFIWFEERFEGTRHQRMKLDQMPNSLNKIARKTAKHTSWVLFSLYTALTFVGYFSPIDLLILDFFTLEASFVLTLWVLFFAACTYGNAGWMREIMCTHICPYARFQSAMFDKDTFTVSYDATRGESRGPRGRKQDPKALGLGDCIDCNLCVQVCPTGIDIRNGLQYECINCGACIDACDGVMDKMNYKKGLISYTTERQLSGGKTHILRSKLAGYALVLITMLGLFSYELATRTPIDLDILRDRGRLYKELFTGEMENSYTLKILNKSQIAAEYKFTTAHLPNVKWQGEQSIFIDAGEAAVMTISLVASPDDLAEQITEFDFVVTAYFEDGSRVSLTHESRFFKR